MHSSSKPHATSLSIHIHKTSLLTAWSQFGTPGSWHSSCPTSKLCPSSSEERMVTYSLTLMNFLQFPVWVVFSFFFFFFFFFFFSFFSCVWRKDYLCFMFLQSHPQERFVSWQRPWALLHVGEPWVVLPGARAGVKTTRWCKCTAQAAALSLPFLFLAANVKK